MPLLCQARKICLKRILGRNFPVLTIRTPSPSLPGPALNYCLPLMPFRALPPDLGVRIRHKMLGFANTIFSGMPKEPEPYPGGPLVSVEHL